MCEARCQPYGNHQSSCSLCEIQCLQLDCSWNCIIPTTCQKPICQVSCISPSCFCEEGMCSKSTQFQILNSIQFIMLYLNIFFLNKIN
jgi:hypothetical protein